MNKKLICFIVSLLLILIIILLSMKKMSKTYEINILKSNDIVSVSIDTLAQENNVIEFKDEKTIEMVYGIFSGKVTKTMSVNDNPINPEILFYVTFKDNKENSASLYIYKKGNNYYIEQPYNGIYKTSKEDFEKIQNLVK